MSLFAKKAVEPAAPPAPPKSLKAPSPRATLADEVRALLWPKMSPSLCAAVGVSWSDLSDWYFGASARLTQPQLENVARHLGLLTPVSALEVIREALEVRLRQRPCDWGASRNNRPPDRGVEQGAENPSSAAHVARLKAFVDYGEIDIETLQEFVRERWGAGAWYDSEADAIRKRDTATRIGPAPWSGKASSPETNERTIAWMRERLKQLEGA